MLVDGHHLRVDDADKKELDFTKTIFVGNLPFKISDEQLRSHFEQCGEIKNVRVIRDKERHEGKGFGYVYFASEEGFKNALQLNASTLLEREIRVKKAVPENRLLKKKEKVLSATRTNAERRLMHKSSLDPKAA